MLGKIKDRRPAVGDWAYSLCGERYTGHYSSREGAINAAKYETDWLSHASVGGEYVKNEVFIGKIGEAPDLESVLVGSFDMCWFLESADQYVCDNYHAEESSVELIEDSKSLEAAITSAISAWCQEEDRGHVNWWLIESGSVEKVEVGPVRWTVVRYTKAGVRCGPISELEPDCLPSVSAYGFPSGHIGDVVRFDRLADASLLAKSENEGLDTHRVEPLFDLFTLMRYSHHTGEHRILAHRVGIEEAVSRQGAALSKGDGPAVEYWIYESGHIPDYVQDSIEKGEVQ